MGSNYSKNNKNLKKIPFFFFRSERVIASPKDDIVWSSEKIFIIKLNLTSPFGKAKEDGDDCKTM